ncbi:hypothetical protein [Pyxidicoccus xibeiensis]|uniref:hypothetical protein n=1 Tax=Pyxidicoccus xibeiensis TaxID=2906759 RepID=UPI0020A75CAB|nr:hypothetical protein [Pyxidicoccus xibeiensis]MCP3142275.1 hypothetical protein [Pyxidicoccus xibeiensis]
MLALLLVVLMAEVPAQPPLEGMKLDEVLACAGDPTKCEASDWDLARVLARRFDTAVLAARIQRASSTQRRVLAFALYMKPRSPAVMGFMKKLSSDGDEEVAYYALNYRAKACDRDALATLVAPPYEVRAACEQWATTVSLVGQCHYVPGGAFLLNSLGHACLNVVQAAKTGLRALYPDAPATFESESHEKEYFEKRVKQVRR